jgi:hypothetical protein
VPGGLSPGGGLRQAEYFAASSQTTRLPILALATLALMAVPILNIAALHRVVWV